MTEQIRGTWVLKAVKKKDRRIAGYFSTADEDREGESFDPAWFLAALSPGGNYYRNPVVLFNHDTNIVIGHGDVATFKVDEVGAYGEFVIGDDDYWAKIERGDLRAFSWFGYVYPDEQYIDLIEVTVAPTPVNPNALFEVRSKALRLGLATEADFPDYAPPEHKMAEEHQKPTAKAITLGTYLEPSMCMAAVSRAQDALMWRVSDALYDSSEPLETRLATVKAMLDEHAQLCYTVVEAIMPHATQAQAAVKAIRSLWKEPEPVQPGPASGAGEGGGDDEVALTQEETQALATAIATGTAKALGEVLQPKFEQMTEAIKAIQSPVAAAAAVVTPPAEQAKPAEVTPPVPESSGDAAVKGLLSDDQLAKLAAHLMQGAVAPGVTKGLQTERSQVGSEEAIEAKVKALVGRVKETKYEGSGVELAWRGHLEDAIAIEMAGLTFEEVED